MTKLPLTIQRGKREPFAFEADDGWTVDRFTQEIQRQTGLHRYRQGLKFTSKDQKVVRLTGRLRTLSQYDVKPNTTIELKDLGPQFSYRGVFVVEYLGPILIMLAYALRPSFLYGGQGIDKPYHWVAKWGIIAWILHFVKRELETFFVHRFSRPTMPLFNLFKNSMYYWGFAAFVGYPICSPLYTPPTDESRVLAGFALMALSELLNFAVHLQLRLMRPKEGSDTRQPPSGGLFNLASCPNYTFEVLGWVGWSLATNVGFAYMFTVVGFLQMTQWAFGKHRNYCKQKPELKRRAAIIPFLL